MYDIFAAGRYETINKSINQSIKKSTKHKYQHGSLEIDPNTCWLSNKESDFDQYISIFHFYKYTNTM
jgi:hypothetical protein